MEAVPPAGAERDETSTTNPRDAFDDGAAIAWFELLAGELEAAHGEKGAIIRGRHHARYHREDTVYHIVSRTFQGRRLLTPNRRFRRIAAAIIARGQANCGSIRLYAHAFLSNHFHLQLRGTPHEIPKFVWFIEAELTRRWGPERHWSGTLWHDVYLSTALPTAESQLRCFEYILSQGVKEGLRSAPEQWPGLHMARQLFADEPFTGDWLNATKYGKALYKDGKRKHPRGVDRCDFTEELTAALHRLPVWKAFSERDYRGELDAMRSRVIANGERARAGKPVPGDDALIAMCADIEKTYPLPRAPWWEKRRRLIVWADPRAPETRAYLQDYWAFQRQFSDASPRWCVGDDGVAFPGNSFRPARFERARDSGGRPEG